MMILVIYRSGPKWRCPPPCAVCHRRLAPPSPPPHTALFLLHEAGPLVLLLMKAMLRLSHVELRMALQKVPHVVLMMALQKMLLLMNYFIVDPPL